MKTTDETLKNIQWHFDRMEESFKVTRQREEDAPAFIFQTGVAEGYHAASIFVADTRSLLAKMMKAEQENPKPRLNLDNVSLSSTLQGMIADVLDDTDDPPELSDGEAKLRFAVANWEPMDALAHLLSMHLHDEYRHWLESDCPDDHAFVAMVRLIKEFKA